MLRQDQGFREKDRQSCFCTGRVECVVNRERLRGP